MKKKRSRGFVFVVVVIVAAAVYVVLWLVLHELSRTAPLDRPQPAEPRAGAELGEPM